MRSAANNSFARVFNPDGGACIYIYILYIYIYIYIYYIYIYSWAAFYSISVDTVLF